MPGANPLIGRNADVSLEQMGANAPGSFFMQEEKNGKKGGFVEVIYNFFE